MSESAKVLWFPILLLAIGLTCAGIAVWGWGFGGLPPPYVDVTIEERIPVYDWETGEAIGYLVEARTERVFDNYVAAVVVGCIGVAAFCTLFGVLGFALKGDP